MHNGRFGVTVGLLLSLPTLATPVSAQSARPAYAQPSKEHERRDVISPDETGSMPRGFHVEQRLRMGPIIGGAASTLFGGLLIGTGLDQRARSQNNSNGVPGTPGSGGEFLIIPGVIALVVGLPLLSYGLLSRREVYVRDSAPQLKGRLLGRFTPRRGRGELRLLSRTGGGDQELDGETKTTSIRALRSLAPGRAGSRMGSAEPAVSAATCGAPDLRSASAMAAA